MCDASKKLRVAICGGGISGLCLAVLLSKHPHVKVDLYEATGQFKEIGAGVMIWSRTWRILEHMGLASAFAQIAHAPPDGSMGIGFDYRRSDQGQRGFRFHLVEMPYGCIRFHRASFLDVFINHLPEGIAHFGKRLTSYTQSASPRGVKIQFADGSTTMCDLLVGCDGIKSSIRAQIFRTKAAQLQTPELLRYIDPVWTGTVAYRGLIQSTDIDKGPQGSSHTALHGPVMYCGKGKHVVSYSISQGSVVNVVTFASKLEKYGSNFEGDWVSNCSQQELLECYAGWEPEVESLLKLINKPTRWAIHHLNPLPFYVDGHVVLVGDSAHAMSPHQGAGAGQAIEDAFILSSLLAKATSPNLDAALSAYETVRLPIANSILRGSFESGQMYEFDSTYGDDYQNLGPAIQNQWNWVDETTPQREATCALNIFKSKLKVPSLL